MAAKPLYIASSVEELMKIGDKDKIPGGALFKEKIDKVSKAAHDALIIHDEERAYVLYYRVADALVREMKKNNADKKFLDLLFKDLLLKSTMILEDLGRSLVKRYEEEQKLLQDPPSAKNTSTTAIANGTPPRENKENVAGDFNEEAKITCKALLHLVKDSNNRILLIDVRPSTYYEQSFISKLPGNVDTVHVREEWLGSVLDSTSLESCVSPEHLTLLKNRKSYSDIIIFDGCSMKLNDSASLNKVFQLLWTFGKTAERSIRPPIILEGGFQEWILTHPTYVFNSNYHPRMPSPVKGRLQDVYRNNLMTDAPEGTVTNGITHTHITHPVHRTYLSELLEEMRKSTPGKGVPLVPQVQVPKPSTVPQKVVSPKTPNPILEKLNITQTSNVSIPSSPAIPVYAPPSVNAMPVALNDKANVMLLEDQINQLRQQVVTKLDDIQTSVATVFKGVQSEFSQMKAHSTEVEKQKFKNTTEKTIDLVVQKAMEQLNVHLSNGIRDFFQQVDTDIGELQASVKNHCEHLETQVKDTNDKLSDINSQLAIFQIQLEKNSAEQQLLLYKFQQLTSLPQGMQPQNFLR